MKDLGISNVDMQSALGYTKPNVIAMMKSGSMRLPASKAMIAAQMLEIDPAFLLGKVLAESDSDLWDTIASVFGKRLITNNELALLTAIRHDLNGQDINLVHAAEFQLVLSPVVKAIAKREKALAKAAIDRTDE